MERDSPCYPRKAANEAEEMAKVREEEDSFPIINTGAATLQQKIQPAQRRACGREGWLSAAEQSADVIHEGFPAMSSSGTEGPVSGDTESLFPIKIDTASTKPSMKSLPT